MRRVVPALCLILGGCVPPVSSLPQREAPPSRDALYAPERVVPGQLEYAPDADTFAPVLTRRTAYPTQREANAAFRRSIAAPGLYVITLESVLSVPPAGRGAAESPAPSSIRLFACAPDAFDDVTARVAPARGIEVHCATDFLDEAGKRLFRTTANFQYGHSAWRMEITHPPTTHVAWSAAEHSPRDVWWWVPFRDRYE